MAQPTKDNVAVIKDALLAKGIPVAKGRSGGIRAQSKAGCVVDIFTLTGSPDQVRARIKLKGVAPSKRDALIKATQGEIDRALSDVARFSPFRLTREDGDLCIYNSVVDMAAGDDLFLDFDEPVKIQADAVEVIDEEEEDDELISDATGVFELDFDLEDQAGPASLKTASSLSEKAVAQLEAVDAKMLRQSLDMMNLKRSSQVRLSLTRICRNALDIRELEEAIESEAHKIVSPDDRKELEMVRSLCVHGFLSATVELLWQTVFKKFGQ